MPFNKNANHPEIPMDTRADAHGQDSGNMAGGEYVTDPGFRAMLDRIGHSGAWTDQDAIYAKTHSGKAGRSLMAMISKYLDDTNLRQGGQATPPATGEPSPAPTPTPGSAPAPVGRKGAFDELEVAIGHMGLGDSANGAPLAALLALEVAFEAAVKKIRKKLEANSAWEAAVNAGRLSDLFGTTSRFTQHQLQTTGLSADDWKKALGLTPSDPGSSAGIGIAGGVKP